MADQPNPDVIAKKLFFVIMGGVVVFCGVVIVFILKVFSGGAGH